MNSSLYGRLGPANCPMKCALSWVSESTTEWLCAKHLSRINHLAGKGDTGKSNERMEPGREWATLLLVGDRIPFAGLPGRKAGWLRQAIASRVLETIAYPHAVPFKTAWSCRGMPELEPGSGEGQNHFVKQMCNERDGRPIKTYGCVQPADHGPYCWSQTEGVIGGNVWRLIPRGCCPVMPSVGLRRE